MPDKNKAKSNKDTTVLDASITDADDLLDEDPQAVKAAAEEEGLDPDIEQALKIRPSDKPATKAVLEDNDYIPETDLIGYADDDTDTPGGEDEF